MKKTIGTYLLIIVVSMIFVSCSKEESSETIDDNYEYSVPRLFGFVYDNESGAIANAQVFIQLNSEFCDEGGCWKRFECNVGITTTDNNGYYDVIVNLKNACDASFISIDVLPNGSTETSESYVIHSIQEFDNDGMEINHTIY
jgi:hypothetical protein